MTEITQEQREKFSKIGKSNVRTAKAHERRIANLLTEWTKPYGFPAFRRRRVEGRGDDVKVVEGVADVIPVSGDILFAIEAKKGEGFSIDGLMASPKTAKFTQWWHQASYDAKILGDKLGEARYPMLFFKPHPNWDWVAVPFSLFQNSILQPRYDISFDTPLREVNDNVLNHDQSIDDIRKRSEVWFTHIHFDAYAWIGPIELNVSHTKSKNNRIMVPLELLPVIICRWVDFAANIDPRSIFRKTTVG